MEKKEELKKRFDDIKNLIKANSKDAHYAETLISELLSLDREIRHESTLVHIPMDSVTMSCSGDTYEMCYTSKGESVYRTTGGYTLISGKPDTSLNQVIRETITLCNDDSYMKDLTEEQKNLIIQDIMATTWVLNIPTHACDSLDFKYKLVDDFTEHLNNIIAKAKEQELQEETPKEDKEFEDFAKGVENVVGLIDEEVKEIKE